MNSNSAGRWDGGAEADGIRVGEDAGWTDGGAVGESEAAAEGAGVTFGDDAAKGWHATTTKATTARIALIETGTFDVASAWRGPVTFSSNSNQPPAIRTRGWGTGQNSSIQPQIAVGRLRDEKTGGLRPPASDKSAWVAR